MVNKDNIGWTYAYCSQCGEKIKKKVICPNCKAENDGSSSYCYRCGHRL